jgi:hypothetical protein
LCGVAGTILFTAILSLGFMALNRAQFATAQKPDLVFYTNGDQDRAVHNLFAALATEDGYRLTDITPITPPEDGHRIFNLELHKGDVSITVRSATQATRFFVFVKTAPDSGRPALVAHLLARLRPFFPSAAAYRGP